MDFNAPDIDYAGLSPIIALTAGICVVLLVGLFRLPPLGRRRRRRSASSRPPPASAIWQWGEQQDLVAGALRLDELALAAALIALFAAAVCALLAIREPAAEDAGQGAFGALLLGSVLGMVILAEAQNLVTFFIGLELLSIPLYVMCASAIRKEASLESGLKYLVIGSLGSATLLYGFALLYGGSGSTDFSAIADALGGRPGRRHADPDRRRRWSRSGSPSSSRSRPSTSGRPTSTRAPRPRSPPSWRSRPRPRPSSPWPACSRSRSGRSRTTGSPALAALAVISIAVGNVGALGQDSLKRLLGYSGIAQAGYMLAGIVVVSPRPGSRRWSSTSPPTA